MIPDEVVEQVSQQADIVAIIGEHVKLKKVGSVWRGPCPFHQGTNANFSVMPRGGYTCFVCGEKGSVFTFVQKRLGMSFVEAVKYVGAKAGIEVVDVERKREGPDPREPLWELQATVAEFFQHTLWDDPAGAAARDYLAEREVPRATAERFGLGFAPREVGAMRAHLHALGIDDERQLAAGLLVKREDQDEPRPRFRDRLMFPILDQSGHTVGFGGRLLGPGEPKYLNSAESDIFSKGRVLYNLSTARNAIRRDDRVLVVEGYFDALRLVDAGIECVVAPMGTALTEQQAELLGRFTRHVFLLYDSDAAGQKATFRAADVLLAKGLEVRVVTMPEGEDPDTFTHRHGRDAVERLLESAMDVFDRKVQLLERAGWFADLQHKRRALDRLLPTIRAASDPITRDLYLARAADAAGIAREVLLRELHAGPRRGTSVRGNQTRGDARGGAGDAGHSGDPGHSGHPDDAAPVIPSGPYRSGVEQGNAEQTLIRVLLTQPVWQDQIFEELGKLSAEELPGDESVDAEAFVDDDDSVLRDPVYRAIYEAAQRHGADAGAELFTHDLDPLAVHVYEELRGEPDAVVDAKKSIADAVRQLRARSLDARVRQLESLLALADAADKDRINVAIKRLADEKRALGVMRWGSVRRRRGAAEGRREQGERRAVSGSSFILHHSSSVMTDIHALLALQSDDVAIHEIETRMAALEPRIKELDARRQRIVDGIARQTTTVDAEAKKQAFLRDKIAEHRALIERNQAQLDAVKTMRQATAAATQMEQAKAIVASEESDLLSINRRLEEMRGALTGAKGELAACEAEQTTARTEVADERATLEEELKAAQDKRNEAAKQVPAALLSKYDRIRNRKRVKVLVALSGLSCGACDTAIPMQLRHVMMSGTTIEMCEVCGVLMYHEV